MVRYKRRYKKTTNLITMKFQSFMDIHTIADQMQIISISAGGKNILERLPAQFHAYKYYKIGNISVKLVPASTLPVDPTGLSIAEGDNLVDPRDQLTPGMMRITNGEDVFEDITGMSAENQHALYNSMMLDPRWYKWMLQTGVKRHASPRYWQIGQLHQDKWPGATLNIPQYPESIADGIGSTVHKEFSYISDPSPTRTAVQGGTFEGSSPYGFFQTGHKGVLGWMPTDGLQLGTPFMCAPPEVEVMKIILPPAYKTEYWYRAYISETVYFREPKIMAMGAEGFGFRPLDNFVFPGTPIIAKPSDGYSMEVSDQMTGGNYGDN